MTRSGAKRQGRRGQRPSPERSVCRRPLVGPFAVALLLIVLTAWWGGPAWGSAEAPLDGRLAFDYARQLLGEGDLEGAKAELKRFLFFCPTEVRANEARQLLASLEPGTDAETESPTEKTPESSGGAGVATAVIHFYQDHLRTFRRPGASCPSYPSCSAYTLQAVEKHGAILGTFIFVDRFWREVTTAGRPPQVMLDGRKLHYDPLENNDYWLAGKGGGGN